MMRHVTKIKNDRIETTADLFLEWFEHKDGYVKGISRFLEDEKLDKLFSVRNFTDVMSGEATIPAIFVAPMIRACPFKLTMREAADIMHASKLQFRTGYTVEMDRAEVIKFHALSLSKKELRALKESVAEEAFYDDKYKEVVKNLETAAGEKFSPEEVKRIKRVYRNKFKIKSMGYDVSGMSREAILAFKFPKRPPGRVPVFKLMTKDERSLHEKRDRMKRAGLNEASMSDDEVRAYIKPRTRLSTEQRKINKKRKSLEKRGKNVSGLSDEEIMKDRRFTGRQIPRQSWLVQKRRNMVKAGVPGAETMTTAQVKRYSYGNYKLDGSYSANPKLYQKKKYLDRKNIDYEYWTDDEILNFDGRYRQSLGQMQALAADRKAKGMVVRPEKDENSVSVDLLPKVPLVERLEIADEEKAQEFSERHRQYYKRYREKNKAKDILRLLNGIANSKSGR